MTTPSGIGRNTTGSPSAEERAWNEAHGLTAACRQCGGAMKGDGRDLCSWACWHRASR